LEASDGDEVYKNLIRDQALGDLNSFAKLVLPHRVYGEIHDQLFKWWTRDTASDHQLCLLPRDHQKSHCVAVRAAWWITKYPDTTIIYMSATATLAEKQLKAIKDILTSRQYLAYWPEMINEKEGKRERWTTSEISVDHPLRKLEGIRDPTVTAVGVTGNITGLHCQVAILDDLVVPSNAYTEEGRSKVAAAYSQLASVETANESFEWVVGTRYHPLDLYSILKELEEEEYDDEGTHLGTRLVYEIFERTVEENGKFLWPKEQRGDGKWFGFDHIQLSRKKAKYVDQEQFYAQYYNNPNALKNKRINRAKFQYYDPKHVKFANGYWEFKGERMNVYAAIDFAFSLRKTADYTALVVIGVIPSGDIFILDIERFRTDKIGTYYAAIADLHSRWMFRKLRAETTVAQQVIVKDIQEYIKNEGLTLSVDEYRPSRTEGSKQERIMATLDYRYDSQQMWHTRGGLTPMLEHELLMVRPEHDDIKDALTMAIQISRPPMKKHTRDIDNVVVTHPRFGGVAYR
jgi:hypothetical protein